MPIPGAEVWRPWTSSSVESEMDLQVGQEGQGPMTRPGRTRILWRGRTRIDPGGVGSNQSLGFEGVGL